MKFYLLEGNFKGQPGTWYVHGGINPKYGEYWQNICGGRMPKHKNDVIIKEVEAEDWDDLNWKETYLGHLYRDLTEGWLSPTGEFVQAGYMQHEDVADFILKKVQSN